MRYYNSTKHRVKSLRYSHEELKIVEERKVLLASAHGKLDEALNLGYIPELKRVETIIPTVYSHSFRRKLGLSEVFESTERYDIGKDSRKSVRIAGLGLGFVLREAFPTIGGGVKNKDLLINDLGQVATDFYTALNSDNTIGVFKGNLSPLGLQNPLLERVVSSLDTIISGNIPVE